MNEVRDTPENKERERTGVLAGWENRGITENKIQKVHEVDCIPC